MLRKILPLLFVLPLAAGCASRDTGPVEFTIAPGQYAAAFDAAKEVLRDYRFDLERVDARAGVLTSTPKSTGGLATPWDRDQSSMGQELEDMANNQQRRVRITFEPAGAAPPTGDGGAQASANHPPVPDVRLAEGPIVARVQVAVDRVQRPLWRVEETSISRSSFARDPALAARGMQPSYAVPFSQDPRLAQRIARAIEDRMTRAGEGTHPAPAPASQPAEEAPPASDVLENQPT